LEQDSLKEDGLREVMTRARLAQRSRQNTGSGELILFPHPW